ncbi:RNase A-like domain-containing protein [Dongia sp.]|uniref:RNase A-like domain-containing protein n=1 Tax=Dongia sp. TaxID=1977262 RepID=UPI0035ADE50D
MPAAIPERIRLDPKNPESVKVYFKRSITGNEGPKGHGIAKHVGKTKEDLHARYQKEPNISNSSTFPDIETAEEVVHAVLAQKQQK